MPDKRNDETPTSIPARPGARARKCRTCKTESPAALVHGECADCAGLIALPLRGAGGRFMTFTRTSSTAGNAAGGER